jgi:acyl transferase domain-containing protein/3-hydroxymyristoyl/3-hydroxydecanoyl-(acyl carrier protein) dehydratase
MPVAEPIAVVGFAVRFPGSGPDPDLFWRNVASATDCSREVPAGRWVLPPERCIDPRIPHPDSVPHARGYFLDDFTPDLTGLTISADLVNQLDPLFHLVLDVGGRAWQSARTANVDRRKAGVILGNICLPTEKANALARKHLTGENVPVHPLNRYVAGLPAGLLAKALGLGGCTFTLDAACASSLYAVKLACDELQSGRAEVMLAGGVNRADSQYTSMGFAQLRALSPSGRCSPFDAKSDGLMVGEGAGVFVLKRLSDAERDGDSVHGVLAGWGLSNDVAGNLLAPAKEGQLRAMRAAYTMAGWRPESVDLIECHATGTPVGDAVEFDSLRELRGNANGRAVIGSVKSTVGHLLTGAGAAALAKVLLAIKHRTLPPQANFASPNPALQYDGSLRVLKAAEAWEATAPRRAAVSGFGFGGVNAHLLVEEYDGPKPLAASPPHRTAEPIAVVGLAVKVGPWDSTDEFRAFALGGGVKHEPAAKHNGWEGVAERCPPGHFLERLSVPLDRFRIPPKELEEMLPQQVLMLQTAADAVADAKADGGEQCGVFVGLGLDLNTTNYHVRWSSVTPAESPSPPTPLPQGIGGPALTADRTMGALGSIAASRIARLFGCGGPSFTCCSEESSSATAVQLAVRALRLGEIDRALVGGVDFTGDPRQLLATSELTGDRTFADGAAALVLKRLSDAERDGDRVYAVLRGVGAAGGGVESPTTDRGVYATSFVRACADAVVNPDSLDLLDTASGGAGEREALEAILANRDRPEPLAVSALQQQIGHTGFATGAVALVRACLALHTRTLPPTLRDTSVPSPQDALDDSSAPRYWLADAGSPRRAAVAAVGADGSVVHLILEEHARTPSTIPQPLGDRGEAVFAVDGGTVGEVRTALLRLQEFAERNVDRRIEPLAREWLHAHPPHSGRRLGAAVVARDGGELIELATAATRQLDGEALPPGVRDRVFATAEPLGPHAQVAFVFPGSGNQFAGMGRAVGVQLPWVLHRQQAENRLLRSQYAPELFWADTIPPRATAKHFLFGQVTLGTLVSDTLVSVGVKPTVMLGKSLGESAGLFGLRVWADRDDMLRRIQESTLFGPDLGPPYESARRHWHVPDEQPLDWVTGVLAAPADEVRKHLRAGGRAFVLIVNTPTECVVGGVRSDVEEAVRAAGKPFVPLSGVTLAHCEAGRPVERPYRELHTLPVTAVPGLTVYSGARGEPYPLTTANAADSITAGLLNVIDFPRVVEAAYRDGVRAFIEVGPGNSCTRMIGAILGDRPHLARSACGPRTDEVSQVLRVLAALHAERFTVDLAKLYPAPEPAKTSDNRPSVTIPVGLPAGPKAETVFAPRPQAHVATPPPPKTVFADTPVSVADLDFGPFVAATARLSAVTAEAHAAYLRFQQNSVPVVAEAVGVQNDLIRRLLGDEVPLSPGGEGLGVRGTDDPSHHFPDPPHPQPLSLRGEGGQTVPRALTFEQCTTFAVGRIGDVLGPLFADIDTHPTRVRLPEGPLMLVDRVLSIEGEPKSMKSGRVVTDHTVRADRWYLDNGRCPTSVTVESGQADLFLSGFLGIDFETKGLAVYRLLDAVVTFHRGLPAVGERIEYDIHIDEFFRQADSWLFRFRFEGTVNGQPLLSMKNGVAGFFTAAALAAGQGIVHTKLDRQPMPGMKPDDWQPLAPFDAPCSLDAEQVHALHRGDLTAAFGDTFTDIGLSQPMRLPSGMLKLVDRVPLLDPAGGRFGLGFVRAEYDIKPQEWFIECHFVDDKVMPGTLMYECCLHTLRTLLMRMGWVGEEGAVTCEPVPGVQSRLKCRGQVLDTTKLVTYEVSVKELGYGPEPYCVADALMYADGKPIVEIGNLSLRMSGLTRDSVGALWSPSPPTPLPQGRGEPRIYDAASIRAFSNGNPSDAFGEPYRVFDRDRVIARLPGPPYQFLDRVTNVVGEPFVLKEGAACTAEYAVPPGEWYFDANRCERMPFSVLLEIALQPCGWLAAYCGSALTSDTDLSFRNLGGKGTQFEPVWPNVGTLTTRVTMTKVAKSAGMIIQHYDMKVSAGNRTVYEGTTYFGFFAKEALRNQVGMPQAKVPYLNDDQKAFADKGTLPHDPPFPTPMLRMVDIIDGYLPRGGKKGLGLIQGRIAVDPSFWFFKAHFYQDPVWPGSLGLESFLQLLKYVAWKRWKAAPPGGWQTGAVNQPHTWTYRGQVVPTDREVTVVLEVTAADDVNRRLTADGFLTVDGRVIYQMQDFTLE